MDAPDAGALPVLRQDAEGIATLTIHRPRQFNALDGATLDALAAALAEVGADASVRAVVVAGAGRAFCPGHDLKEMMGERTEAFVGDLFARCSAMMQSIRRMPQPVIARVHGIATAAGCQLVAACDLAVASDDARFATSGINYGLFCATPAVPLSRNVAVKRAFEMLFTGAFIDAATARDWGLVNRVVPAAELDAATLALARALADKPRATMAAGKAFFYAQLDAPLAAAYEAAGRRITADLLAPPADEGVGAFLAKRRPDWSRF